MSLLLDEVGIDTVSNTSYVYHCFNAMNEISKSMSWVMEIKDDDDIDDEVHRIYERNYIITLVETLCRGNYRIPEMISGEVAKDLFIEGSEFSEKYAEIKRKLKPDYKSKPKYVYPDFLIHNSHKRQDLTNQHLIIEAKTSHIPQKEYFYLDFLKLVFYIKCLRYENAAYLIVNNNVSEILNYVNGYIEEYELFYDEIIPKLFFFIQEKIDSTPKMYMLRNE